MNEIQKFFRYRQALIEQYAKGDMTKREYLARNLDAVTARGLKPFKNVDNVEKGLFNYQYYNAFAKDAKSRDDAVMTALYYDKKDRATLTVLRLLDFREITAYYIKARSKMLQGRLIEIVISENGCPTLSPEWRMILHTTNDYIRKLLRDEGALMESARVSEIDGYINQKY